jgi:mRNA-degrading endonuclease RelE of RelBE toxin-antitoxin system
MLKVVLTEQAQQELEDLGRVIHFRVLGIVARLGNWPLVSGAKPLRHGLAGRCRVRTGDYRVQSASKGRRSSWKRSAIETVFTRHEPW